jgi:hypothetical protein
MLGNELFSSSVGVSGSSQDLTVGKQGGGNGMSLQKRTRRNDQISQQAAEWLVEIRTRDIDAATRRTFDSWLRASPEHIRAFMEMAALWHDSVAIDPRRRFDVEEIIVRAKGEENLTRIGRSDAP